MAIILLICCVCAFTLSSADFEYFDYNLEQSMFAFSAAVYNDILHTVNGKEYFSAYQYVYEEYSTSFINPFSWGSTTPSFPSSGNALFEAAPHYQNMFSVGNILFIVKADFGESSLDYYALLMYDLSTQQYLNTSSSLSTIVQKGSCVTFNPKLNVFYAIGGSSYIGWDDVDFVPLTTVEIYNLTSEQWKTGIPLDYARFASGCAMDSNSEYIFVFGGMKSDNSKTDVYLKFTVSGDLWSDGSSAGKLNTASFKHKCLLFIDDIYCVGGSDGSSLLADVNVFNTNEETMDTSLYSLNIQRYHFTLFSYNNCIYVAGGISAHGSSYPWAPTVLSTIEYLCITNSPTEDPTDQPSIFPTYLPTISPSVLPSYHPSKIPSLYPSLNPSKVPSILPTSFPSSYPSKYPSSSPTNPSSSPTANPSSSPTSNPSSSPSKAPTIVPTSQPTTAPTEKQQDLITDDSTSGMDGSVIALIVVSSILVLILIVIFVVWFARKKHRHKIAMTNLVTNTTTMKVINGQAISMVVAELEPNTGDTCLSYDEVEKVSDFKFEVPKEKEFVKREILSNDDIIIVAGNSTAGGVGWNEEFQ